MNLNEIGFYTLSDERVEKSLKFPTSSFLQRCELIVTDKCNFKCQYCRGVRPDIQGELSFMDACHIINIWANGCIENIRFSGGEPTIWGPLVDLVSYTKNKCKHIKHIAISTNGSAPLEYYKQLIDAGVNDFSISFDACCSSTADNMAGVNSKFENICNNIKELSKLTYVTVGVVLDDRNISELENIIDLATSLGVHDIRIIPSAQDNRKLSELNIQTNYPILKYRLNNITMNKPIRGLCENVDSNKCRLLYDDMVIAGQYHFPCIIYMREYGNPIGTIKNKELIEIRNERYEWVQNHDCFKDPICRKNCLDVCVDYNNKMEDYTWSTNTLKSIKTRKLKKAGGKAE